MSNFFDNKFDLVIQINVSYCLIVKEHEKLLQFMYLINSFQTN